MIVWKDVVGYEDKYQVSCSGVVWNKWTGTEVCQVIAGPENYKYKYVNFHYPNKHRKLVRVHRVVGLAHIPNPHKLPHLDHINRDILDNQISNLRWCTRSQNMRNTKNNVYVVWEGQEILLIELVEKLFGGFSRSTKMDYDSVHQRMFRSGRDVERAIEERLAFYNKQYK